jgi:16S rRNA (guanine527-N7)-methyltransferase
MFAEWLKPHGIALSDAQLAQFETYGRELAEWNEKMNLTAIKEREQVYVKHFYDSVSLSFFVPMAEVGCVADIGTGAGFPGIPLKIVFPHLKLVLVDSLAKRVRFLEHVVGRLGLSGVACCHARAEDAARDPGLRDAFDLVTARAVARLPVLAELCLPFAAPGGRFVAMKGPDAEEEVRESARSLRELGGELVKVHRLVLPVERAERLLIEIRKKRPTPAAYPRKAGIPARQPLV